MEPEKMEQKPVEQNIPGMRRPGNQFVEVEYAQNIFATLKQIGSYFAKEKTMVIGIFAVVIAGTLCGIYAPSLQSDAIDLISESRLEHLPKILGLMLLAYLGYSLGQLLQNLLSAHLSQRIVRRMRADLFGKIIDLPIKYLDTHSHGDVMSRMTNDIENISTTVSQSLPSLFSGILTIIGTVGMMLWYCWQLALLSCTSILLTIFVTKVLSQHVRRFSRRRQTLLGALNGTVEEMISGYHTVMAYNYQDKVTEDFYEISDSLTKADIFSNIFSGIMGPIMNSIGNIGFVIVAVFGGYFSMKGIISIGVISAFIVYAKQFSRPANELAQVYGQLQTAIAGAERVFHVLKEANEDKSGQPLAIEKDAWITFQNIHFSYESDHPVLRNFSLEISPGKKIALVGATGSGKTTVVNLLTRFYDPDSGSILVNGQDISTISRDSLRQAIAIVLQDTTLFSDTIRNNLIYANADVTEEQLDTALKMSGCREMLKQLPDGLDTMLTSSGKSISQGQRQLLAIARAFTADPKILILDEATSNIDTRTEKIIQDAMHQIMKNRTSIIIAHRLSTIRDADIIIVMEQGEIIESGSHETLLAQKGKYYELYMTQYAGIAT